MENIQNNNSEYSYKGYKIPEKFIDSKSGKIRIDALIKSYLELEKMLSNREKYYNKFVNDSSDKSDNILSKSLQDEDDNVIDPNDIVIKLNSGIVQNCVKMNQELLHNGFNIEQIQKVYEIIEDWVLPEFIDFAKQMYFDNEIEKLNNTFGGADKFELVANQLYKWAVKNLSSDVLKILASSYNGIVAMYYMMIKSEPMVDTILADIDGNLYTEDNLKQMMKNPKYWLQKDPDFIRQVSDGFKQLYGNQAYLK